MLRRHSIKSKPDLNRRKSTPSAHGVQLEYIDPTMAHRDAHIAACQAYTRAQNSTARAGMLLFPPTLVASPRRQQTSRDSPARDKQQGDGQDLRWRQSVRFIGSCSVQRRTVAYTTRDGTDPDPDPARVEDDSSGNSEQCVVLGQNRGCALLQPPRCPNEGPPPLHLSGLAAGYIDALTAGDDYYTPEDDIASIPSSYRRIRRSRSLFTDEQQVRRSADGTLSNSNTKLSAPTLSPAACYGRKIYSDARDNNQPRLALPLRTPKSMSFLRTRCMFSTHRTSHDSDTREVLVGVAPSHNGKRLVNTHSMPRLKTKTPVTLGSRNQRTDLAMRKSLRKDSSADGSESYALAVSAEREESFKIKTRKASKSFKTRLRGLFGLRQSEEGPPSIPCQHIKSRKLHVSEGLNASVSPGTGRQLRGASDWSSFQRVPSGLPSLQTVPPNLIHSDRGSLESLTSERERMVSDDRSLTSWTNSGPSTLTSQQQQQWKEWEMQRLSVIKENGSHAPFRGRPSTQASPNATIAPGGWHLPAPERTANEFIRHQ